MAGAPGIRMGPDDAHRRLGHSPPDAVRRFKAIADATGVARLAALVLDRVLKHLAPSSSRRSLLREGWLYAQPPPLIA